MRKAGKVILWILGILATLLLLVWGASFVFDKQLRGYLQGQINKNMENYSVTIGALDFNPLILGLSLEQFVLTQDSHPDPPVLAIPEGTFKIDWSSLFKGELGAVLDLDQPHLTINRNRMLQETEEDKPLKTKGWRKTLSHIYPIKVHQVEISHGKFTYIPKDKDTSIVFTDVFFRADNIRHAADDELKFPSNFKLRAKILEEGQLEADGTADFLAGPHLIFRSRYTLDQVRLEPFAPLFSKWNLSIDSGRASSAGEFEFTNNKKAWLADSVSIDDLKCDYIYGGENAEQDAKKSKGPSFAFEIDQLQVNGEIGFIHRNKEPTYRIYIADADLKASHLSDRLGQNAASARLEGQFMGSGDTLATGEFSQLQGQPDFQITVKVVGTQLEALNDLMRAYADLDAVDGSFALYASVSAKNGKLDGFVKPFITSADFYDLQKQHGEGLLGQMYEGFADLMTNFLQGEEQAVGTKTPISGSLEDPEVNSWTIVVNMIQHAFFEGIVPGFETRFAGD